MEKAIAVLSEIGFFLEEIIMIFDNNKKILYRNDAAKRFFGIESDQCRHNFLVYCSQNNSAVVPLMDEVALLPTYGNRECQVISIDGDNQSVTIDWKIISIPSELLSSAPNVLLNGKNMSREYCKDEKIYGLEVQLNSVIEIMTGNYWWKDLNGIYKGFNQSLVNLLGVSREDIIGKSDHDLPWADTADQLVRNDNFVMELGHPYKTEEEIKSANGEIATFDIFKIPLKNKRGEVVGVIGNSVDITERKKAIAMEKIRAEEALQLTLKVEQQKIAIEANENFVMAANKVAHDLTSPLATLKMMMGVCTELPEEKRTIINRALGGLLDIVNNLLATYKKQEQPTIFDTEPRQSLLISDFLVQILSEKRVQYNSRETLNFEIQIENDAQFAFANMQPSQFKRTISNLINNAVDALDEQSNGVVSINVIADSELIGILIQDNGKGMPKILVEKMLNRQSFTDGKKNGHGLGMLQVWDTVDSNQGTINVTSSVGEGTTTQLTFPRVEPAIWIAYQIQLASDSIIVILDDDTSIHGAWGARFGPFLESCKTLRIHHFTQGDQALKFFRKLNLHERERLIFLSDYELLKQEKNGLRIIELSEIRSSTLITSYYDSEEVREKASQLQVKILPKKMASIVPINLSPRSRSGRLRKNLTSQ